MYSTNYEYVTMTVYLRKSTLWYLSSCTFSGLNHTQPSSLKVANYQVTYNDSFLLAMDAMLLLFARVFQ